MTLCTQSPRSRSTGQIRAVASSIALATAVLIFGFLLMIDVVSRPESIRRIILTLTAVAFGGVCQFAYHCIFIAADTSKLAGTHSDFFSLWDQRSVSVTFATLRPCGSFKPGTLTARHALKLS